MNYYVSEIRSDDKRYVELLKQNDLKEERNISFSLGLFDEDGTLVAGGSAYINTLRCLAVRQELQGEGLLSTLISALIERLFSMGHRRLFVYTKADTAEKLKQLGFYDIANVDNKLVFMENDPRGFENYINGLKSDKIKADSNNIGAIVMNANPFTLGHRYLIETAAKSVDILHLFMVREDLSYFPFEVRKMLIKKGTEDIKNIVYHDTDSYLVSASVFPSYFIKEEEDVVRLQAGLDAQIFLKMAAALNIKTRFVGTEPLSMQTNIYNEEMQKRLPKAEVNIKIIDRKQSENGDIISASLVRNCLKEGDVEKLKKLVPKTTLDYLLSDEFKALTEGK